MRKSLLVHAALLLGNIGGFVGMAAGPGGFGARATPDSELAAALDSMQQEQVRLRAEIDRLSASASLRPAAASQGEVGGRCQNGGDPPGVTVYLETTPPVAPVAQNGGAPVGQWTAVSFKDAGRAPDGSNQAVLSIQKIEAGGGGPPAHASARWQ